VEADLGFGAGRNGGKGSPVTADRRRFAAGGGCGCAGWLRTADVASSHHPFLPFLCPLSPSLLRASHVSPFPAIFSTVLALISFQNFFVAVDSSNGNVLLAHNNM
jgi:hypothetical protein